LAFPERLNRTAGGADKVAKDGHIRAVDSDAAGVHGQAELFGLFKIYTRVIEFREAETLRGQNAVKACRIDRAGRTMTAPGAARYLVELLPVAFVPSGHAVVLGRVPYSLRTAYFYSGLPSEKSFKLPSSA
jgi:hypothetical protein